MQPITSNTFSMCSFCSNIGGNVQVVCGRRCLICSNCQVHYSVQQLLISKTNSSIYDRGYILSSQSGGPVPSPGTCPICGGMYTRSMFLLIRDIIDKTKEKHTFGILSGSKLEYMNNYLIDFLRSFRASYGDGAGLGLDVKFDHSPPGNNDTTFGSIGSITIGRNETPSSSLASNFEKLNRAVSPPLVAMNSAATRISMHSADTVSIINDKRDHKKDTIPSLSARDAMSLIADFFVCIWQNVSRGNHEAIFSSFMFVVTKKKSSNRLNDYRAKALIDYILRPQGQRNAICLLFGKIVGLYPKPSSSIRPVLCSISTVLMILCYCGDSCFAAGEITEAIAPVAEFRQCLNGLSNQIVITVKQAVYIIDFMIRIRQPEFVFAPLSSACVENNSKRPWEPDSIARLLHLIFFVVLGDRGVPAAHPTALPGIKANLPTVTASSGVTIYDVMGGGKTVVPVDSFLTEVSNVPSCRDDELSPVDDAMRPSTRANVGFTLDNIPKRSTTIIRSSKLNHRNVIGRVKLLTAKAEEFWRGSAILSLHPDLKIMPPIANFSSLGSVEYHVSAPLDDPETDVGVDRIKAIENDADTIDTQLKFSFIDISMASTLAEDLTVGVAKFILAVLVAWEREYTYLIKNIEAATFLSSRRRAVKGSFDRESAKLNPIDRMSFTRVVKWYESRQRAAEVDPKLDKEGDLFVIDWMDMKARARDRLFPFAVSESLVKMSAAELNYHYIEYKRFVFERERRENQEDEWNDVQMGKLPFDYSYDDLDETFDDYSWPSSIESSYPNSGASNVANAIDHKMEGGSKARNDNSGKTAKNNSGKCLDKSNRIISSSEADIMTINYECEEVEVKGLHHNIDDLGSESERKVSFPSIVTPRLLTGFDPRSSDASTFESSLRESFFPKLDRSIGSPGLLLSTPLPAGSHPLSSVNVREQAIAEIAYENNVSDLPPHQHGVKSAARSQECDVYLKAKSRIAQRIALQEAMSPAVGNSNYNFYSILENEKHLFGSHVEINSLKLPNKLRSSNPSNSSDFGASSIDPQSLTLRNRRITSEEWDNFMVNHLGVRQLRSLRKLELTSLQLDKHNAINLHENLRVACRLVDLDLSDNSLGDWGALKILQALVLAGSEKGLLRLSLRGNDITCANDGLTILSKFSFLRQLDLSCNRISLDIQNQRTTFVAFMAEMLSLQSFSIAFNSIQDIGFELIADLLIQHRSSPELKKLDLARCNLSGRSLLKLRVLCQSSKPRLEHLLLQDNLFTSDQLLELKQSNQKSAKQEFGVTGLLILTEEPYHGIDLPLRYTVNSDGGVS